MVVQRKLKSVDNSGFTIWELLVVAVILAIFATVLSLRFSGFTATSQEGNLGTNLAVLRSAIGRYQAEHGTFPGVADSEGAVCPGRGIPGTGKGQRGAKKSFAEQLTMYTNRYGQACSTTDRQFRYGPYIKSRFLGEDGLPTNPITNKNKVKVMHDGLLDLTSKSDKGGWKYDRFSGMIIVDHKDYDDL